VTISQDDKINNYIPRAIEGCSKL